MNVNSLFYEEFRRQGKLLMPDRPVLLALLKLYTWLATSGADFFTEDQLRDALKAGEADSPDTEHNSLYTPWQRHTLLVRELQVYWLLRGVESGTTVTYRFKPHARAICKRLHTTLFSKLVVSQVEAAFRRLQQGLGESEEDFLNWARELLPLGLEVEQQLVALDNDIEETIRQLRQQTSQSEESFLAVLDYVSATLDNLLQKADELNRAFDHAADLEQELTHIYTGKQYESEAVDREAREALRFIRRARQRLNELSLRLDWVRPRVRAVFGNLKKLRFDRKTEQFLERLLNAEPTTKPQLPAGVALARLVYRPLRYERVPHAGQVLPAVPVPAAVRPTNQRAQQDFKARTEEMLRVRGRVQHWLTQLRAELLQAGATVDFREFGQRLADSEGPAAYEIVAQVLATVRREDELNRNWQLHIIAQEEKIENEFGIINLWKLTLTNP
ncbi:hypothetical protein HHL22_13170 [Hymenobacter sp. RP-2-7]|uniref:DUF3375 domain-containing protein n=1 Tax=Hymenobacter polaris TaxID=2682546 RepID=A0A7Y0AF35_9BACT|nr:hypothetical protein [Hymenobacter polaris]NML66157.1 hypothetical protein [Hymenobacter polaris]